MEAAIHLLVVSFEKKVDQRYAVDSLESEAIIFIISRNYECVEVLARHRTVDKPEKIGSVQTDLAGHLTEKIIGNIIPTCPVAKQGARGRRTPLQVLIDEDDMTALLIGRKAFCFQSSLDIAVFARHLMTSECG